MQRENGRDYTDALKKQAPPNFTGDWESQFLSDHNKPQMEDRYPNNSNHKYDIPASQLSGWLLWHY